MLDDLRVAVCDANRQLPATGLVHLTWGNVSAIDRDRGIIGIKPSGVPYADLRPEDIVLVDLEGVVVEGLLKPSSDTKTHLQLYLAWEFVGGVCHTHSVFATSFAQAGIPLPCLGTTHADHFYGPVPVCRCLTPDETAADYERQTGHAIVTHFADAGLDPAKMPAVLQHHHAPFTWGKDAHGALENSVALETCARMARETLALNPAGESLPGHILEKHHLRKHGPDAYYGQA
ncbi:L-ribulose-5-phosphate 4-epimerase [soil metagenome]